MFSETDQTDDLRKMTVPTLIIHGDDDQIVPIGASAHAEVKIAPKAQLKVYPGASHGRCSTHKDQINADPMPHISSTRAKRGSPARHSASGNPSSRRTMLAPRTRETIL